MMLGIGCFREAKIECDNDIRKVTELVILFIGLPWLGWESVIGRLWAITNISRKANWCKTRFLKEKQR